MISYIYIIRMNLLTSLAYRFEVFSSVISHFVVMFAGVFVWKAAYSGMPSSVEGVTERQMVTYIIVSFLISGLFDISVEWSIGEKMRDGSIVSDFIRPLNPFFCWLMEDIGQSLNALFLRFLPLLLISSLVFGFSLPCSLGAAIVFIPSCLLSYFILWFINAITGMLAFWIIDLRYMGIVTGIIIEILSGSMIPLWFFPEKIQSVSRFLPFQYTYQTPLGIYIGKTALNEAIPSMLLQALWVLILAGLACIMWKRAKKRLFVQGG